MEELFNFLDSNRTNIHQLELKEGDIVILVITKDITYYSIDIMKINMIERYFVKSDIITITKHGFEYCDNVVYGISIFDNAEMAILPEDKKEIFYSLKKIINISKTSIDTILNKLKQNEQNQ